MLDGHIKALYDDVGVYDDESTLTFLGCGRDTKERRHFHNCQGSAFFFIGGNHAYEVRS